MSPLRSLKVLREVKCLETLRHQNITQYHHAWIEKAQLSRFGPPVPVLFILMDYANGGTLDAYIETRRGAKSFQGRSKHGDSGSASKGDAENDAERRHHEKEQYRRRKTAHDTLAHPHTEKLASKSSSAFKAEKPSSPSSQSVRTHLGGVPPSTRLSKGGDPIGLAIHLFGLEEILNVFTDTCSGLAFLHSQVGSTLPYSIWPIDSSLITFPGYASPWPENWKCVIALGTRR